MLISSVIDREQKQNEVECRDEDLLQQPQHEYQDIPGQYAGRCQEMSQDHDNTNPEQPFLTGGRICFFGAEQKGEQIREM